jgi:sugar phosphate isomerase/epimerase
LIAPDTVSTRSSRIAATDTTIGQANHVALDTDHQFRVDVNPAEVIDQNGNLQAVIAIEDSVQQRRFCG